MGIGTATRMNFEKKRLWLAVLPSIVFITLMWLVFIVDYSGFLERDLSHVGILPRELKGLKGILVSPFIHSSFTHLLSNTLPLLIQICFLFYFYSKIAFSTFFTLWILSGLFTWLIGRNSYHVGASGLVFALLFFLFFSGIFRRYSPLVAVSLVVAFIYGGTVWSVFPFAELVDANISWEGHLSGAISGTIIAVVYRNQGPQRPVKEWEDEDDSDEEGDMSDDKMDRQVKACLKIEKKDD